ncbi:D-tyrosyl-tRNA(Tyr) deacylase [bacterium]|nr:D-tyrosyl-tRNA(Tyr) deacylase [bacterium]
MKAVLQRVAYARVEIAGETAGEIGRGLLVLLGVGEDDGDADLDYLARKIPELRIFEDDAGKMNLSVRESGGQVLVVSQFTLFADTRKGRRPAFTGAARPEKAEPMYEALVARLRDAGLSVATGRFGAMMRVELVNDGPVTILLDSRE